MPRKRRKLFAGSLWWLEVIGLFIFTVHLLFLTAALTRCAMKSAS
jgi:hypothetical protein